MTPERNIKINPAGNDERARSLITLIDNLIAIVNEENVELAKGLPASRLKQVDEKNRLASLFEQCVAEASARPQTSTSRIACCGSSCWIGS